MACFHFASPVSHNSVSAITNALQTYFTFLALQQLTVAKSRCEKRIQRLGGPDYKYYTEDKADEGKTSSVLPDLKVLYF